MSAVPGPEWVRYLLLILTFTFLRLVIVLMKERDKQIIEAKGCVRA